MQIHEKVLDYSFSVTWVIGKTHYIADALSRYLVFGSHDEEFQLENMAMCLHINKITSLSDITSVIDKDCGAPVDSVRGKQCFDHLPDTHVARLYNSVIDCWSIRGEDTDLDDTRIVAPSRARKLVLQELHRAHKNSWKLRKTQFRKQWIGIGSC